MFDAPSAEEGRLAVTDGDRLDAWRDAPAGGVAAGEVAGVVRDCVDPQRLAEFWAPALGYTNLGAAGSYVLLVDEHGGRPKLLLQAVPEAKAVKNRMHFDIEIPDIKSEAARLESLVARRVDSEPHHEHGSNWIVMTDPEGNEFCVCDADAGGSPQEQ
jgi:predicted enzyme related to lactoylglutathione lyase